MNEINIYYVLNTWTCYYLHICLSSVHLRETKNRKETFFPNMTGFCHLKKEKCITINILWHVKPANRTITAHGCNVIQMQRLHQDLKHLFCRVSRLLQQ